MELLGHEVTRIQEGDTRAVDIPDLVKGHDVMFWTQTFGLAETGGTNQERLEMLADIRFMDIPTVGFHLDLWHGLDRADQIAEQAFFRVDHLFTADGGHDDEWKSLGVNHHWLPPGVYGPECYIAETNDDLRADVGFVGGWRNTYHPESTHRHEMIKVLRREFPGRLGLFPLQGTPAIRGHRLNQLYAGIRVVVGDSCMVGNGAKAYWSDRVSECLGRGGMLLHPWVEGIDDHFTDRKHLVLYEPFNWEQLKELINFYLENDGPREGIRHAGHEHVKRTATYEVRVQQILDILSL